MLSPLKSKAVAILVGDAKGYSKLNEQQVKIYLTKPGFNLGSRLFYISTKTNTLATPTE